MTRHRPEGSVRLRVLPIELKTANAVVGALHRHHAPVLNHRFSVAAVGPTGMIRGVAIVGRPVARAVPKLEVLEVLRVATDGTPNACSALLGAAAKVGRALGYVRIQTYTLTTESGASLRGAGWVPAALVDGRAWRRADGAARNNTHPLSDKVRWERELNPPRGRVVEPPTLREDCPQAQLFGKSNKTPKEAA